MVNLVEKQKDPGVSIAAELSFRGDALSSPDGSCLGGDRFVNLIPAFVDLARRL